MEHYGGGGNQLHRDSVAFWRVVVAHEPKILDRVDEAICAFQNRRPIVAQLHIVRAVGYRAIEKWQQRVEIFFLVLGVLHHQPGVEGAILQLSRVTLERLQGQLFCGSEVLLLGQLTIIGVLLVFSKRF